MVFLLRVGLVAWGFFGNLVVGEPGQSPPVAEARIQELSHDIRAGAAEWKNYAQRDDKNLVLRRQVT